MFLFSEWTSQKCVRFRLKTRKKFKWGKKKDILQILHWGQLCFFLKYCTFVLHFKDFLLRYNCNLLLSCRLFLSLLKFLWIFPLDFIGLLDDWLIHWLTISGVIAHHVDIKVVDICYLLCLTKAAVGRNFFYQTSLGAEIAVCRLFCISAQFSFYQAPAEVMIGCAHTLNWKTTVTIQSDHSDSDLAPLCPAVVLMPLTSHADARYCWWFELTRHSFE